MTPRQKRKFLFGELPLLGGLGALLVAFFTLAIVLNGGSESILMILSAVSAFGLVILGVFYLICWLDIRRSKGRCEVRSV
jgi:UDP-N-acetylmuramyl pentapeptide phosphotransferase/UDP-N-acetylglucosamine-1-phosphate transferase